MKNTARARAIVLPAVLALGLSSGALAAPAFADTAPAPSPTAAVASIPAPADLEVTSPADGEEVHGIRSIVVTGRAPAGSTISVTDDDGNVVGTATTDATGGFSIPITFPATVSYDQYLLISGTARGKELTEQSVEVLFDAPQSAAPVILTPTSGYSAVGTPAPFGGFDGQGGATTVDVTGTATPGDEVFVYAESADPSSAGFGWADVAQAGSDGTWSSTLIVGFGSWTVTATAQAYTDNFDPLTTESDPSNSPAIRMDIPSGYVAPPQITSPAYPDAALSSSSSVLAGGSSSSAAVGKKTAFEAAAGARPTRNGFDVLQHAGFRLPASAATDPTNTHRMAALRSLSRVTAQSAASDTADLLAGLDRDITDNGIQVTGTADPAAPGTMRLTVSGTGTPGDGIQLYANTPSKAFVYFEGLYPDYFRDAGFDPTGVAPATPPASDGTITVAADGTWTTALSLSPGPYFITAFAVDTTDPAAPTYSLAGSLIGIHLSGARVAPAGTPAVVSAVPTLADTGSDLRGDSLAPIAVALSLLAGGAALGAAARRRRVSAAGAGRTKEDAPIRP